MMNLRLDRLVAENNQFFYGKVVASDAATYSVQIAPESGQLPALLTGIALTSVMANMLGVKECVLPQPGSTAFCFKSDAYSCLILGIIPDADTLNVPEAFHARATLGAGDSNTCANNTQGYANVGNLPAGISKSNIANVNRPTDVVEGEYVLANEFGILFGLFQQFAVLKASELAQVQAFVFDDLVRIVSHNFEHFTCMGSSKVYQDGPRLTQEFGITHDAQEATGRPNITGEEQTPVIELTGKVTADDKDNFFKLKNENQTSIDRLRGFVGALGDFLHLIFSRPVEGQLRALDGVKTGVFDRGLASVKMNMDGTMAFRSLGGIALEKTNWIRVPHRIKSVEEVETAASASAPTGFTFDSSNRAGELPFLHFLQLRDYLAYSLEGEAYQQFANSDKFEVNDDPNKEEQLGEQLQLTPDRVGNFYPKSSGFYLMPNGGIVLRDAWGSSIVLEGGNICLQPAKDLVLQPLRNLVGKVGKHVSIAAQNDIDLSSTSGGFRLKTDLAQYLYSASSGIVLHADVDSPFQYYPEDDVIQNVGGIVLNAPKSGIVTHSQHSLFKTDINSVIKSKICMIDAEDRVLLRSGEGFDVFSAGDLILSADRNLIGFTQGEAIFVGIKQTAIGMQEQVVAVSPMGPVEGLFEEKAFDTWRTQVSELSTGDFQHFSFAYREDTDFDGLLFRFQSSSRYGLVNRQDALPQTLAQQEDLAFENLGLTKWVETPVNETYPYPGAELEDTYAVADLHNLKIDAYTKDTYNKAVEHSAIGQINFVDLFQEYSVYA